MAIRETRSSTPRDCQRIDPFHGGVLRRHLDADDVIAYVERDLVVRFVGVGVGLEIFDLCFAVRLGRDGELFPDKTHDLCEYSDWSSISWIGSDPASSERKLASSDSFITSTAYSIFAAPSCAVTKTAITVDGAIDVVDLMPRTSASRRLVCGCPWR